MAANPKQALHELVDRLDDADAARALGLLQDLATGRARSGRSILAKLNRPAALRRGGHRLPVLWRGRPIADIDELRDDIFPPDESVEEFDAAIRRWRSEGMRRRDGAEDRHG